MSKSSTNRERRDMVEQMRKQAKAAERRRTLTVVAICVVVALVIVGFAGYTVLKDRSEKNAIAAQDLSQIGTTAASAGCTSVKEEDATGAGQHVTTPVTYQTVPPAFGPHNPTPAPGGVHFYTADDRPSLEMLVHNLEHGWTIVWYDETVAGDGSQLNTLEATAKKFDAHGQDPRYNVIIAPWTANDQGGAPIPDGKHIALTHWSIHQPTFDPANFSSGTPPSFGESQYCSSFSGAALGEFMKRYPYDDAPEGFLWHQ